jgi:hypothetical protein
MGAMKRLFLFFATFLAVCVTWSTPPASAQTPVAVDDVPLNALLIWFNSTPCPTGYTRFDVANNRFLRIDPSNPESTGGQSTHSHAHSHSLSISSSTAGVGDVGAVGTGSTGTGDLRVYSGGGGATVFRRTSSTSTDSTAASNIPPYYNVVLCQKTSSYEVEIPEPSAITATITFTPTYVESPYAYTTTLDTGNNFRLERSVTYGDIISGAGSILVFALLVILGVWRLFHDRNA